MHLKYLCFAITIVVLIGSNNVVAWSFFDSIPVASQLKSLVQAVSGDMEGARKTQENFVNTAPVASQVKSLVESIKGDNEAARKTQEQFLKEFLEPTADNTPIVGHIKGAVHMALGDKERGEEILKGASVATAIAVGAMVGGGPLGAVAAGAAADGIITAADSAVKGGYNPYGIVEYIENFEEKTPAEHAETLWEIIGVTTDSRKKKYKNKLNKKD